MQHRKISVNRCRVNTMLDRNTGQALPRGGHYLEISWRTPMDSPFLSAEERSNRDAITGLFRQHGWWEYPWEFWHYSSGDSYERSLSDSGQPAQYGPIIFNGIKSIPIPEEEADRLLDPVEYYEQEIQSAIERIQKSKVP